jgi:hypothetical protein
MPYRALRWLILGFATLWFGVLVPVHNRGEIALPGAKKSCHAVAAHQCCPAAAHKAHSEHNHDCPDPASPLSGACAVCFFISGLDTPPPVTVLVTRLGLVGAHDSPRPQELPAARITLPFHSRAPPHA